MTLANRFGLAGRCDGERGAIVNLAPQVGLREPAFRHA